jgi:hypothetical protein
MTTRASAKPTYSIPVSNGLFAHRERIGPAIWVFLWLIDATTKEVPGADGKAEGHVYGGQPVPLSVIAVDLGMSRDAIFEHLALLTKAGYIRKVGYGNGRPNGYAVVNSKRFANRRTKANRLDNEAIVQKPTGTVVQKPDDHRVFVGRPSYKSPSIYKEEELQDNTRHKSNSEDEPITAEMIATGVLQTLGLSGCELLAILGDICKSELKRGKTADWLRDSLVAAGSDFSQAKSSGKLTQYAPGMKAFFGEGYWKNRKSWKWKDDDESCADPSSGPKYNDPLAQLAALGLPARRAM